MDLRLKGNVAVVTGGGSGIGLACAELFAREGCAVSLWDLSPGTGEAAAKIRKAVPGSQTHHVVLDMGNEAEVNAALGETETALGSVNHVVHAAAIGSGKFGFPFTNLQPEDWRRVLEINILGMVNVAHALGPSMVNRREGSMVFIASVAGQIGSQTDPPYSASKAANINFAQCLAKDLAPHNVRVNVVNPGMVRTALNQGVWKAWHDAQAPEHQRPYDEWAAEKIRGIVPLARWQETTDIANMVVFLSSQCAAQVTGQTINVDGGQVMHW